MTISSRPASANAGVLLAVAGSRSAPAPAVRPLFGSSVVLLVLPDADAARSRLRRALLLPVASVPVPVEPVDPVVPYVLEVPVPDVLLPVFVRSRSAVVLELPVPVVPYVLDDVPVLGVVLELPVPYVLDVPVLGVVLDVPVLDVPVPVVPYVLDVPVLGVVLEVPVLDEPVPYVPDVVLVPDVLPVPVVLPVP